jgi:hypothetical protein
LGVIQQVVREYAAKPNVVEFLEPHGELRHGDYDVFLEYGPVADRSYRQYLQMQHHDLATVSRRWYGDPQRLRSWDDVRVPEVASFLGYDAKAIDLAGQWQVGYEKFAGGKKYSSEELQGMGTKPVPTDPPPPAWFAPDFDDRGWPTVVAPGNDRTIFLPKRPAVYRRRFEVGADWARAAPRSWIYVWDLNSCEHLKERVIVFLNGKKLGEDRLLHAVPHWCAVEATGALQTGANTLALRLPKGFLAYRVYLSSSPPAQYPCLGKQRNAQWVDFADWRRWSRLETVRRGMEMIRQVDPDRSIVCMAPDSYVAGIKQLCEAYGGHFHNTGYMSGWWAEYLPMLSRGSDLPFSLEPGGPAKDLPEFKQMLGLQMTEGIQAIHYFIHVGNILWDDSIRGYFKEQLPLIHTVGKVHPPKAEIAMLCSDRVNDLGGYPWGKDANVNLNSGYFRWPLNTFLTGKYDLDGLTDLDLLAGNAAPYRMIVDSNTSIMDERLVDAIEKWVREGGIFVTFVQTGRHTPEKKDAWPISRLTGYRVKEASRYNADGEPERWWKLRFAPGQTVFAPEQLDVAHAQANGLKLEPRDPDCRNIILWEDGTVAAGIRPLGRGCVVNLGLKFCRDPLWDGGTELTQRLFEGLFHWAKLRRVPAAAGGVLLRHYVSNNGLYDFWTLWNRDAKKEVKTQLVFAAETSPAECVDVKTGLAVPLSRPDEGPATVGPLRIAPLEMRMFRTPREEIARAPWAWYALQTRWWRGTTAPSPAPLKLADTAHVVDLSRDWAVQSVPDKSVVPVSELAAADADASKWPRRDLQCWAVPEELPTRHVILRREFRVPDSWDRGEVTLWIQSWVGGTFMDKARARLDGKELANIGGGVIVPLAGPAGSRHTVTIEVQAEGDIVGSRGNAWLAYTPRPLAEFDLAGLWTPTADMLHDAAPLHLPGPIDGMRGVRRSFQLPAGWEGKQVYLYVRGGPRVSGAIVNGRYVRRHHHALGDTTLINVTPWIVGNGKNEVEILAPGHECRIAQVALWAYDTDEQP